MTAIAILATIRALRAPGDPTDEWEPRASAELETEAG